MNINSAHKLSSVTMMKAYCLMCPIARITSEFDCILIVSDLYGRIGIERDGDHDVREND